jgi:hypothetical protein
MAFRIFSSNDSTLTDLETGLAAQNYYTVGYAFGAFVRDLLTV